MRLEFPKSVRVAHETVNLVALVGRHFGSPVNL